MMGFGKGGAKLSVNLFEMRIADATSVLVPFLAVLGKSPTPLTRNVLSNYFTVFSF